MISLLTAPFPRPSAGARQPCLRLEIRGYGSQHALCVADDERNTLTLSITGLNGHFSETIKAHVAEPGACMLHVTSFDQFCRHSYKKGQVLYDEVEVPGHEADGLHRRFQFPNEPDTFGPEHSIYLSKMTGEDQLAIGADHAVKPLNVDWQQAPTFMAPTSLFSQAVNLFATAKAQGVRAQEMQVHLDMDSADEIWLSTTSGPVTAVYRASAALDKIASKLPINAVCPRQPFSLLPSICSQAKRPWSWPRWCRQRPAAVYTGNGWTHVETVSRQMSRPTRGCASKAESCRCRRRPSSIGRLMASVS